MAALVNRAVYICERLLALLREQKLAAPVALDFAQLALKLPRARDPISILGKIQILLKPYLADHELIAGAVRELGTIKRKLKAAPIDKQLVGLAAGGHDAGGEPEHIGNHEYVTGAAATSELQRQYLRSELHRAAGTIYSPPGYSGASEAVTHYKLDTICELEKARLIEVAKQFRAYAKAPPSSNATIQETLKDIADTLQSVKSADTTTMQNALEAEANKLAAGNYCAQLATHIRQDITAVLPYKSHVRDRHQLKKAISAGIAALQSALEQPLPAPDSAAEPALPQSTASIEQHYTELQQYFTGEYAKLPWFQQLESHMNSIAKLMADLRGHIEMLISPEHLDTCLTRLVELYKVILQAQHLARALNKSEYRMLVENNFSKFPKLVIKGHLQVVKV